MSKIYKILFLSVNLFFITNEAWMAQPSEHPERKVALPSRVQHLPGKDSRDGQSFNEDKELSDRLMRINLSSKERRTLVREFIIEKFPSFVEELIKDSKVSSGVKSLMSQLQASKGESEEKVIGLAKALVKKLFVYGGIGSGKIIRFIIRKKNLFLAQAFFELGLPFNNEEIDSILEILEDGAYMLDVHIQNLEVLNYLKANDCLLRSSIGDCRKKCLGCLECLKVLEAGASVNVMDSAETVLHHAVVGCHEKFTDILIAVGVDVNAQDIGERTPLHALIVNILRNKKDHSGVEQNKEKYKSIIKKLLDAKASVDVRDSYGKTALELIRKHKLSELFAEFGIQ